MNYERELRHRLQKFGWQVMETTKDWLSHLDENSRPVYSVGANHICPP